MYEGKVPCKIKSLEKKENHHNGTIRKLCSCIEQIFSLYNPSNKVSEAEGSQVRSQSGHIVGLNSSLGYVEKTGLKRLD